MANNKEMQIGIQLMTNDDGSKQVIIVKEKFALIKQEYRPVGDYLEFPKAWGVKKGALHLVQSILDDKLQVLERTRAYVEQLQHTLGEVQGWDD